MKLRDLPRRPPLAADAELGKIPWDQPEFSRRMLREHLAEHDAASRRAARIDAHVEWIHDSVLRGRSSTILDLGCGPGLYTSRLARLGHRCTGIDFSPASIEHARAEAERDGLACSYRQEDLRTADYGRDFDLAMLLFGELNAFARADVHEVLASARAALTGAGTLLLEVLRSDALEQPEPPAWSASEAGLFSDAPHLWLRESAWDPAERARVRRWYVVEHGSDDVASYGETIRALDPDEIRDALAGAGFPQAELRESLGGDEPGELCVWLAR